MKKLKPDPPHITPYSTIHLKWIVDLNVKNRTKNLEEKPADYLNNLKAGKDYFKRIKRVKK